MKQRLNFVRRLSVYSLVLTAGVLLTASTFLPNHANVDSDATGRHARIAAAMKSAPYFVGTNWVGEDALDRIPREAQRLLRPNAILSRTYSRLDGVVVHLLIVHCRDMRDMTGHYPPICYPSAGWTEIPRQETAELSIELSGGQIPVREYVFSRVRDRVNEDVIRVLNAFVLPDGRVSPRIEDLYRQSDSLTMAGEGVAQLQVITLARLPEADALTAAGELLGGMPELLNALRVQKEPSS